VDEAIEPDATPFFRAPADAIGALNVYSHGAAGFADAEVAIANVVAEQAAIPVANATALAEATQLTVETHAHEKCRQP
jgi:GAF domain-containing protein